MNRSDHNIDKVSGPLVGATGNRDRHQAYVGSRAVGGRRSRATLLGVVLAIAALLASACGGGSGGEDADSGTAQNASGEAQSTSGGDSSGEGQTQHVTVAFAIESMNSSFAAVAVAQYLGYWEDEGLDVETKFLPGSSQALRAVEAGQADIAAPVPQALIPLVAQGKSDQVMFYNWAREQVASLAVLEDSDIKEWSDFKGTKIGAQSLGSGTIPLGKALLRNEGVDPETDVKFVSVGLGAEAYHALKTDRVQALMLFDSQYAAMENLGAKLRYFTSPLAKKLFATGYSAKKSFISKNPDVIAGFGRALTKANVFTTANPEAAIKMMYKVYPKTHVPGVPDDKQMSDNKKILALRTKYLTAGNPSKNENWGSFPVDGVKAWIDYAVNSGLIKKKFPTKDLVTNKFVKDYNSFDIKALAKKAKGYQMDE